VLQTISTPFSKEQYSDKNKLFKIALKRNEKVCRSKAMAGKIVEMFLETVL